MLLLVNTNMLRIGIDSALRTINLQCRLHFQKVCPLCISHSFFLDAIATVGIKVLIKTQNILAQRPLGTMYYTIMSFMIDILIWLGMGGGGWGYMRHLLLD